MKAAALLDGLYKLEISGFGHTSFGVAVLKGGRLLGGDSSHYFSGTLADERGCVRAEILANRHSQHARPAFGPLASAHLTLVGNLMEGAECLTLIGSADEIQALKVRVSLTPLVLDSDETHAALTSVR